MLTFSPFFKIIITVDVLFKIKATAAAQAKPLSSQMFQVVFSGAMPLVQNVGIGRNPVIIVMTKSRARGEGCK